MKSHRKGVFEMKKILSLALAAAMTLSLLAGCGSKDSGSSTSSANSGGRLQSDHRDP